MCDDVQLCNRCVHEFLILTRTCFTFSLPFKTGCDTRNIATPSLPVPRVIATPSSRCRRRQPLPSRHHRRCCQPLHLLDRSVSTSYMLVLTISIVLTLQLPT
jgi:hypothetical protein